MSPGANAAMATKKRIIEIMVDPSSLLRHCTRPHGHLQLKVGEERIGAQNACSRSPNEFRDGGLTAFLGASDLHLGRSEREPPENAALLGLKEEDVVIAQSHKGVEGDDLHIEHSIHLLSGTDSGSDERPPFVLLLMSPVDGIARGPPSGSVFDAPLTSRSDVHNFPDADAEAQCDAIGQEQLSP